MRRLLATAALAALASSAAPAAAVDEVKPAPECGSQFTDKGGDVEPANLDVIGGFFKHDPAKAEQATTINIQIKDLSKSVPSGATFMVWALQYQNPTVEPVRFVRAVTDFSGVVSYEYGEQQQVGITTMNRPLGLTPGKMFEGKDGVVQVVLPQDRGGKAGTQSKSYAIVTYTGSGGPAATPTPTRGPLTEVDNVAGKGTWTAAACPAGGAPAPGQPAPSQPAPSQPAPSQPAPSQPGGEATPLPVKVTTKAVKRSRKVVVKLKSSEPVTQLAAQLVKGKKVLAKGKLARIDGAAKLKLSGKRKLAKGTYRLDLAGTTSSGRRFTSAKLRVR